MSNTNVAVWFEIYVDDMARASAFYETVLEQKLENMVDPTDSNMQMMSFPMDDSMSKYGAPGALVKMEGFKAGNNSTIVYLGSDDCAVEEARVEDAGGKVFKPKMSIGEFGFIALATDTEGNMFGIHSMK